MTIYITEIDKKKFVCGLFWQSLSRPRELKKEATALAKKMKFDLLVLRKDSLNAQAGFAQSSEAVRRGVYSLAAAVSRAISQEGALYDGERQRVQNWLGAFKLPDGMWVYFAVRDANFLPNGDFAGTKEEVLERLQGDYGLGGWNAVIGDAELEVCGFHNFNPKRIQELLPHDRQGVAKVQSTWALVPAARKVPLKELIIGGTALLLAVIGVLVFKKKMEERERERAMAEMQKQIQASANQVEVKPWEGKPLPRPFIKACLQNLVNLTPGGWKLDQYICTHNAVNYSWSRQGSTIEFLLAQLPKVSVDLRGERASYSQPLAGLELGSEALLEERSLLAPMLSTMQLMSLEPQITMSPPPPPVATDPSAPPPPPPSWKAYAVSVQLNGVPLAHAADLFARPGVRIDKLSYRGSAWTIEGVVYAK
jgi:hypothetical protein